MRYLLPLVVLLAACHGPNYCYKGHLGKETVRDTAQGIVNGRLMLVTLSSTHQEDAWICDFHTKADEDATGKNLWKPAPPHIVAEIDPGAFPGSFDAPN